MKGRRYQVKPEAPLARKPLGERSQRALLTAPIQNCLGLSPAAQWNYGIASASAERRAGSAPGGGRGGGVSLRLFSFFVAASMCFLLCDKLVAHSTDKMNDSNPSFSLSRFKTAPPHCPNPYLHFTPTSVIRTAWKTRAWTQHFTPKLQVIQHLTVIWHYDSWECTLWYLRTPNLSVWPGFGQSKTNHRWRSKVINRQAYVTFSEQS